MKVNAYIGEYKIDLFDDEKIEITQKLNDIEKLSNVFSDFTNSFTVPATPNNNRIFRHYYDCDIDDLYNANIRVDGFIEIDTLPFRFGQFQLESVTVKDNQPDNYKISFYGKVTQLTELFGSDTIDKLDYDKDGVKQWSSLSQFDITLNQTNLLRTFNDPTYLGGNIITPLIAYSDRDWNYLTGDAYDIANSFYPIKTTELRQALRCLRIIEAIETKYDITISREFFGNSMFNQLFIWMNSKANKASGSILLDINAAVTTSGPLPNNYFTTSVDLVNDIFTVNDLAYSYSSSRDFNLWFTVTTLRDPISGTLLTGTKFNVRIVNSDTGISVYDELIEFNGSTLQVLLNIPQSSTPTTTNYKIFMSAPVNFVYSTMNINFDYRVAPGTIYRSGSSNNNGDFLDRISVAYTLPAMKVIDFIQGIMKMFKLIIKPISVANFYIDTLNNYYDEGNILNLTNFIDVESVLVERPSIYRKINFTFQPTDNVLGKKFREENVPINRKIGYGDLFSEYTSIEQKTELNVELPFENMLFERLVVQSGVSDGTLTNINIGQAIKLSDDGVTLTPNDCKPILFFNNGTVSTTTFPFKYQFGSTSPVQTINSVYNIGNTNNAVLASVTDSINWGSEIDPWHYSKINQSLYYNYWFNWLGTIYSIKQRKVKFDGYLPPRFIQEITLNDRIIIVNKRYKINDYTIDLVTGKTSLNLFIDIY